MDGLTLADGLDLFLLGRRDDDMVKMSF